MTDADRLQAAEQRVAVLESEIRSLEFLMGKQQRTVAAPRPPESPVKITHPVSKASMPSHAECVRLCEIVWQHYPKLRPGRGEEEEFFSQFRAALEFVQHHGRANVDRERSLGWWLDTAREWISQHRIGGFPISGVGFVVAVIAAGDVPFSDPAEPGLSIGLQFGGGGTSSRDWWKRALGGALLEPTPPLHPTPLPAPSRIVRGAV
jgi:hypothetical protein